MLYLQNELNVTAIKINIKLPMEPNTITSLKLMGSLAKIPTMRPRLASDFLTFINSFILQHLSLTFGYNTHICYGADARSAAPVRDL